MKFLLSVLVCLCVLVGYSSATASIPRYCTRGESCWPTPSEITTLSNALDSSILRNLTWVSGPKISSVPSGSQGSQPLFGLGYNGLKPVYVEAESDRIGICFLPSGANAFNNEFCKANARNNPAERWQPAFTVFPTTAAHVQTIVRFAVSHRLCISVVSTGHDVINRHTCNEGIAIRTTLLKGVQWNDDLSIVTFGSGTTNMEAQWAASKKGRYVAGGWSGTVGLIGWGTGGGHGLFAPSVGLGVDQIVAIDLVNAAGELMHIDAKTYPDLYWAIRGGGGSVWGVVISISLKAHTIPVGGFVVGEGTFAGDYCGAGKTDFQSRMRSYINWSLQQGPKMSSYIFIRPAYNDANACKVSWSITMWYVWTGSKMDADYQPINFTSASAVKEISYTNSYDIFQGPGFPLDLLGAAPGGAVPTWDNVGAAPSVLVSREKAADGSFLSMIESRMELCVQKQNCPRQEIDLSLTGNKNSPQNPNVPISSSLRTGLFSYIAGKSSPSEAASLYSLGPHSYFGQSAYQHDGTTWKERYWGAENYEKLLKIKQKYDPNRVFWCRNCVGSDGYQTKWTDSHDHMHRPTVNINFANMFNVVKV